jgi:hypothetical protein
MYRLFMIRFKLFQMYIINIHLYLSITCYNAPIRVHTRKYRVSQIYTYDLYRVS